MSKRENNFSIDRNIYSAFYEPILSAFDTTTSNIHIITYFVFDGLVDGNLKYYKNTIHLN